MWWERYKEKQQKKALEAGREGEEKPFSISIPFFPFFPLRSILRHSPLSEHLKKVSARRNAAIHQEIYFTLLHNEHKDF